MKISSSPDLSNIETIEEVRRFATLVLKDIVNAINGNLSFRDNFKANILGVSFDSANTEVQFTHTLGQTPSGYILIQAGAAMTLYDGTGGNTDSLVYLRSSAAGSGKILLF